MKNGQRGRFHRVSKEIDHVPEPLVDDQSVVHFINNDILYDLIYLILCPYFPTGHSCLPPNISQQSLESNTPHTAFSQKDQ